MTVEGVLFDKALKFRPAKDRQEKINYFHPYFRQFWKNGNASSNRLVSLLPAWGRCLWGQDKAFSSSQPNSEP